MTTTTPRRCWRRKPHAYCDFGAGRGLGWLQTLESRQAKKVAVRLGHGAPEWTRPGGGDGLWPASALQFLAVLKTVRRREHLRSRAVNVLVPSTVGSHRNWFVGLATSICM
jgi:hypothetical protein